MSDLTDLELTAVVVPMDTKSFRPLGIAGSVLTSSYDDEMFDWVRCYAGQLKMDGGNPTYRVRRRSNPELILADVRCNPVTQLDLSKGPLAKELKELRRLTSGQQSPFRQEMRKELDRLLDPESGPTYPGTGLFWYTNEGGKPSLLWCWGYQRENSTKGNSEPWLCPTCRHHSLQESGTSPVCPRGCDESPEPEPDLDSLSRRKRWQAVLVIAIVALLVAGAWWKFGRPDNPVVDSDRDRDDVEESLNIRPSGPVNVPVGATRRFHITRVNSDGTEDDVSDQVLIEIQDARYAQSLADGRIEATAVGSTEVAFRLGDLAGRVQLRTHHDSPKHMWLEAETAEVGVGTTTRLRLLGSDQPRESADETEIMDVSGAAKWSSGNEDQLYVYYGLVEGLAAGKSVAVTAIHPGSEEPFTATINVLQETYDSLQLSSESDSDSCEVGKSIAVTAVVRSEQVERDVTLSSATEWTIDPTHRAKFEGGRLEALEPGPVTLTAKFRDHVASLELTIEPAQAAPDELRVLPETLVMAPDESVELTILPEGLTLRSNSSDESVATVSSEHHVTAISLGDCEVTLENPASGEKKTVQITVREEEVTGLAIQPEAVTVEVGKSKDLVVVATTANRQFTVAAETIDWAWGGGGFLSVDAETGAVHGHAPTQAPETVIARWREWEATSLVEVVSQPLRLVVEPEGPVELPQGLSSQLTAWTVDGQNQRLPVVASEVEWTVQPLEPETESGIGMEGDTVTAVASTGTGIRVTAEFQGVRSDPVEVRPADAAPSELIIRAARQPLFVGDSGVLTASLSDEGEFEFTQGAEYASSDASLLDVTAAGDYEAIAPGNVTVTATHPETGMTGTVELTIVSAEAQLVFVPAEITLAIDSQQQLELVVRDGDQDTPLSTTTMQELVQYSIGQPAAVRWDPPTMKGVTETDEPFIMTANYEGMTAELLVSVVGELSAVDPVASSDDQDSEPELSSDLRVRPATATLAPHEPLKPIVEQQVDGRWTELVPGLVEWSADPNEVVLLDPIGDSLPVVTIHEGVSRSVLRAKYKGHHAELIINGGDASPIDASSADTSLEVVRSPTGIQLPVGESQRYELVWRNGDDVRVVPAEDVTWPPAFEDERFAWIPPVLTAKQAGNVQRLNAEVDDRSVAIKTVSVLAREQPEGAAVAATVELPTGAPERIELRANTPITLAVGAVWNDYRVYAFWADGAAHDVTQQAMLNTAGDEPVSQSAIVHRNRVAAVAPGQVAVHAEFQGMSSTTVLITVQQQLAVDEIQLHPATLVLQTGESARLRVMASQDGTMTDVTDRADIEWVAQHPPGTRESIAVQGPIVTGLQPGTGQVRVKVAMDGKVVDGTTEVTVTADGVRHALGLSGGLTVVPAILNSHVNESHQLGVGVTVRLNGRDVTAECEIAPINTNVMRHDLNTNSLTAVAAGRTAILFSLGERQVELPVRVAGDIRLAESAVPQIVPRGGALIPGQRVELRVIVPAADGSQIDRTADALITSGNPDIISVDGNKLIAIASGVSEISATVVGVENVALATFSVTEDVPIEQLVVAPRATNLGIGQTVPLRVWAVFGSRRTEVTDHPGVTFASSGGVVNVTPNGLVRGLLAGNGTVVAQFKGMEATANFVVGGAADLRLEIRPRQILLARAESISVEVWAVRGPTDRRRLTSADGVELTIENSSIATVDGMLVHGMAVGRTQVLANYGVAQTTAVVRVVPRTSRGSRSIFTRGQVGLVNRGQVGFVNRSQAGLRFGLSTLQLSINDPPTPIRVYSVEADGSATDVTQWAELSASPTDVVSIAGTLIQGVAVGRTQVHASYLDRTTSRPLLVAVGANGPLRRTHLVITPNPLVLVKGDSAAPMVRLVNSAGVATEIPFTLESDSDNLVIRGRQITAQSPGVGVVRVKASWNDATIEDALVVEVQDALRVTQSSSGGTVVGPGRSLSLYGPRRVQIGQVASYRVRIEEGTKSWDVSHSGAQLVATPYRGGGTPTVDGVTLSTDSAGRIQVQARYRDLVSNVISLHVEDSKQKIDSLVLRLSTLPMSVGDSRPMRLVGTLAGRKYDLTGELDAGKVKVDVSGDVNAIDVRGAMLHAVAEGIVDLSVTRNGVTTGSVRIPIRPAPTARAVQELRIVPAQSYLSVGEVVPPLRVQARDANSTEFYDITLSFRSNDDAVVRNEDGSFVTVAPGKTQLVAKHAGLTAYSEVEVAGRLFKKVRRLEGGEENDDDGYVVKIKVSADKQPESIEYQIVRAGAKPTADGWVQAVEKDGQIEATLTSPAVRLRLGELSRLEIFARGMTSQRIERYPHAMKLDISDANP